MDALGSNINTINPYIQNTTAVATTQPTTTVEPTTATTSVGGTQNTQFSPEAIQALLATLQGSSNMSQAPTDPLANLVSNGTITQDQSNSISSAFQTARQANTGTYSSSQTNPLTSLVANGTITQDQATTIQGDIKAGGHHHHGGGKMVDATDTTDATDATDTTDTSNTSPSDSFSSILASLESNASGQSQTSTDNVLESLMQNDVSATE